MLQADDVCLSMTVSYFVRLKVCELEGRGIQQGVRMACVDHHVDVDTGSWIVLRLRTSPLARL